MKSYLNTVLAITLAGALAAALIFNRLPEQVPIHFNEHGVADGFAAKTLGIGLLVGIIPLPSLVLLLAMSFEHRFGRGAARSDQNLPYIYGAGVALALLMLLLVLMIFRSALTDVDLSVPSLYSVLAGVFVLFGLFARKVRSNHVIGIRTPWTLASESVWQRTHRMGGWMMVAGGLSAMVVAAAVPSPRGVQLCTGILIASALVPCAYSFAIREKGQ